jgi:predicted permease
MRRLTEFLQVVRALVRRRRLESELDRELAFHVEMEARALGQTGSVTAEAARREAQRTFGNVTRVREQVRDARGVTPFDDFGRDLRVAARALRRTPGFTAAVTLTLALGIGATTAIFGVFRTVLLAPLPYPDADRLVTVWQETSANGNLPSGRDWFSPANYLDYAEQVKSFERLTTMQPYSVDHIWPDGPEEIEVWRAGQEFFGMMGVRPLLGRALVADDFRGTGAKVLVVTEGFWRRRLGAANDAIGRVLSTDDGPMTIVGVMPARFELAGGRQGWMPWVMDEDDRTERGGTYAAVVGRLRDGVTVVAAQGEADAIAARLAAAHPRVNPGLAFTVQGLHDMLVINERPILRLLFGSVLALLLIACINVAGLMLTRAIGREQEYAIRVSLGAGRNRVARHVATEALVLSALGGLGALGVAAAAMPLLRALAPADFLRIDEVRLDPWVMLFCALVTIGVAVAASLIPAVRLVQPDMHRRLTGMQRTSTRTRATRLAQHALASAQVAIALALLVGVSLLGRSLVSLLSVDRGFRTDNVLTMSVQAWGYYRTGLERIEFVRQAVERLSAIPGVAAAGMTSSLPLADEIGANDAGYEVVGRPVGGDGVPRARTAAVTAGFFDALGVRLRAGRSFTAADDPRGPAVVIINEELARRAFGGENPIGKQLSVSFMGRPVTREIVGIVGNVRHRGLDEEPRPSLYLPHAQVGGGAIWFTVRSTGEVATVMGQVREAMRQINPAMPIEIAGTLEGFLGESLRQRRFQLAMVLVFAGLALVLAAVGTYGVMSHEAMQRTREFAVRIALGATRHDVTGLMLWDGGRVALFGLVAGTLGAIALSTALTGSLYGVSARDPLSFSAAAGVLVAVALVASYLPARRAARTNAVDAMRGE